MSVTALYKQQIKLTAVGPVAHRAVLQFGPHHARCAIGANGVKADKREGDRASPQGRFALRALWYRPDRLQAPESAFPIHEISPKSGWCDDIAAAAYNRPIRRPFSAGHELLWRRDGLYDIFFELGHNDAPPRPDFGSAVFLHLQKNNFQPTLGCVAVALPTMKFIIAHARPGCCISIG